MKILQVNCVFKKGSTGKIVNDLHVEFLSHGHQSVVCYGRGDRVSESYVYKYCTEGEARLYKFLSMTGITMPFSGVPFATWRLKRIIRHENPDIVHLHCINGNSVNIYSILKYLAKQKVRTVITHHAEFFYTGSCGYSQECNQWACGECRKCPMPHYATGSRTIARTHFAWQRMKEAFSAFDSDKIHFAAVSPWVKSRALQSPFLVRFPCSVVMNGIDTGVFNYRSDLSVISQRLSKYVKQKTILHVSASFNPENKTHIKGGWYVVELAKRLKNFLFVVVSSYSSDFSDLPPNIMIWGRATSQDELARLYSCADITLLTSLRETFSMICAESLCCGTPVVGFKAGGPESISLSDYSHFVDHGNIEELESALCSCLEVKYEKKIISETAQKIYSKETIFHNYMGLYEELIRK